MLCVKCRVQFSGTVSGDEGGKRGKSVAAADVKSCLKLGG